METGITGTVHGVDPVLLWTAAPGSSFTLGARGQDDAPQRGIIFVDR
jgi:hypothetical protein